MILALNLPYRTVGRQSRLNRLLPTSIEHGVQMSTPQQRGNIVPYASLSTHLVGAHVVLSLGTATQLVKLYTTQFTNLNALMQQSMLQYGGFLMERRVMEVLII
jgi:hypothetical protein